MINRLDFDEKVRAVWGRALDVPVKDETDFFEVGGHSFLAFQIITRIQAEYGADRPPLSLRSIFDNPRFREFVDAVADELGVLP